MQTEFYELYVNYMFRCYGYCWLEKAMRAKWQLAAVGE